MMNKICPLINQECIKEKCYACKDVLIDSISTSELKCHNIQICYDEYEFGFSRFPEDEIDHPVLKERIDMYISDYKNDIIKTFPISVCQHKFITENIQFVSSECDHHIVPGRKIAVFRYTYQIEFKKCFGTKLVCSYFNTDVTDAERNV